MNKFYRVIDELLCAGVMPVQGVQRRPLARRIRLLRSLVLTSLLALVPGSAGAVVLYTELFMQDAIGGPVSTLLAPLNNSTFQFRFTIGPPLHPNNNPLDPPGSTVSFFNDNDITVEVVHEGSPLLAGGVEIDFSSPLTTNQAIILYDEPIPGDVVDHLSIHSTLLVEEPFTGFPFTSVFAELQFDFAFATNTLDETILELPSPLTPLVVASSATMSFTHSQFNCADPLNPFCFVENQLSLFAFPGWQLMPDPGVPVPEPASPLLLLLGLLGLVFTRNVKCKA